jgi:predicted acyl esterase
MLRPPALKAICSIFASDDRYADDVHYFGGVKKQLDLVDWPIYMEAENALPPCRACTARAGASCGAARDRYVPWLFDWLEHQTYDDFWSTARSARTTAPSRRRRCS